MPERSLFQHALHVGPQYKNHRGGMGAVIASYNKNISDFQFVSSYEGNYSTLANVPYFFVSLFKYVGVLIANRKIKIVHIHGAHNGSFFRKYILFLIAKYVFGKAVVYHSHGSDFHIFYNGSGAFVKKLVAHFINHADLIICLSIQWNDFFKENFSPKRIHILENIVDHPDKTPVRRQKPVLTLLFLGYIGDRKGIYDLVNVIIENKEFFNGRLKLLVGGNGESQKLEAIIKTHSLENIVEYVGWVTGEKKDELLSTSDIFILPSHNEGLPVSILEAMSYNLPIISTPVGGIGEVVRDNVNGFLVEPGNKKSILESLKAFVLSPVLALEMGQRSSLILKPYYSNSVIPKLHSFYTELLTEK
ncbi:N-acetyl-alpha-D-glucosaminyl L-malate synthase [Dyadobacter sp. CECT 9623]|uniref:N-acetyl-alpha-D-glucosaminyl L-malate synthase n=1 Tax=Dyadobacter linearis TaxID=2823330 RepID=A0ABN7R321_9BACT|nr:MULTISPECIES: glycosyltransferase family 4 protein [unclassified Dyadobacter]MCE7059787.1 glycosyltransferase family 4 protein [Dyadobacter sp. CY343]CAG5068545.1 N-acetyl-alpha-D-glucosaminyl L-malate synthase [Dyadobacter sp. CECT 9623]